MPMPEHYRIRRSLGRGTFGEVLLARDERLDREVALKVLSGGGPDPRGLERFRQEARVLALHPHEALVPLLDAELEQSPPFLVFPWMAGGDLGHRLLDEGPLAVPEAVRIGARLGRALAHLHARGILHRDVKPANVLLDEGGEVYLGDAGLTLMLGEERLTESRVTVGTPRYMAREALEAAVHSPASDVFSLGAVVLELVVGRGDPRPFSEVAATQARLREVPDEALRALLRRCLASSPGRRPADVGVLAQQLEDTLASTPHAARPGARPLAPTRSLVGPAAPPPAAPDGLALLVAALFGALAALLLEVVCRG